MFRREVTFNHNYKGSQISNCNLGCHATDIVYIRSFFHFFLSLYKSDTKIAELFLRIYTRILLQFLFAPMQFFRNWDIQPIHHVACLYLLLLN